MVCGQAWPTIGKDPDFDLDLRPGWMRINGVRTLEPRVKTSRVIDLYVNMRYVICNRNIL